MAMGNATSSGSNAMQHINHFMLRNLQAMINANPSFLTGGIPNKLLSQMWMTESMNKPVNPYLVSH